MNLILEKIRSNDADCKYLYELQSIENIRKYSLNKNKPTYEEHLEWFSKVSGSKTTKLYKLILASFKVGMIRVDIHVQQYGMLSIIIDPNYSGRGIAKKAIKELIERVDLSEFRATIHKNNIASIKAFNANEFILFENIDNNFSIYRRLKG